MTWAGRRATTARAFVLRRDQGICWLCGHAGANSLDHVVPASLDPSLVWEPTNWKAAHYGKHGRPRGCKVEGCKCIGNAGRGNRTTNPPPSRSW